MMNAKRLLPSALTVALSTCLAACGGGSTVRPGASPTGGPPPPPSNASAEPCPAPVTRDCFVTPAGGLTWDEGTYMTGGRQSDHALTVNGGGILHLKGENRFDGGTSIVDGAALVVWDSLASNVHVASPGTKWGTEGPMLWLAGTVNGNVSNDGIVSLRHLCGTPVYQCVEDHHPVINGDFMQGPSGRLEVVPGWSFLVTGKASLDGELRFIDSRALNYVLPSAPSSIHVLHADGGVSGQFVEWKSYELFLTGSLRYLPDDVYFDAASVSAAATMARAGADPLTLRSAANFDAALGAAGKWATGSDAALTATQRRFLASVGAIQHLQDYAQATRSLDSLSGHGYADAADALLQQAVLPAPELMTRAGSLLAGSAAGAWSAPSAMLASGAGAFSGERAGFDQWVGDRLLLGSGFGWNEGSLRIDRSGGVARDQSPQWDAYARRNGNAGSYLFGDVGYSRHQLNFDRRIDLGTGQAATGARPGFDVLRAYFETGRDFRVGQSRLTPFGAVSYAALHGAGFIEQGNTGFELIAQPSFHERIHAAAGVRLGSQWRTSGGLWTTLDLTAGYLQLLHARDDARAAFTGVPSMTFALDGVPHPRNTAWLHLGLGTGNEHWNWLFGYDRQASSEALSLGAKLRF